MNQQPSTDDTQTHKTKTPVGLSAQNVARLLSEDSPAARIDVIEKIAQDHSSHHFNESEMEVAQQIFRILMTDTEVKVRTALAHAVKEDDAIPRDIVVHMAQDVDAVSLPVIEHSNVLSESDLAKIVTQDDETAKQMAVARRKHVPEMISTLLVDTQKDSVVNELVGNRGAEIPEKSYQSIVDTFPAHEKIMSTLVNRERVPIVVIENLIHHASGAVSDIIKKKYGVDTTQLKSDSDRIRELTTLKLLDQTVSGEELDKLVERMRETGRLTPSLLLTALCRGNLEFFGVVMAKLAGIPLRNARLLIEDKGDLGFKALYEKARLPDKLQQATRIVLNGSLQLKKEAENLSGKQWANQLVERVLKLSEGRDVENLSYIIALIRQNNSH